MVEIGTSYSVCWQSFLINRKLSVIKILPLSSGVSFVFKYPVAYTEKLKSTEMQRCTFAIGTKCKCYRKEHSGEVIKILPHWHFSVRWICLQILRFCNVWSLYPPPPSFHESSKRLNWNTFLTLSFSTLSQNLFFKKSGMMEAHALIQDCRSCWAWDCRYLLVFKTVILNWCSQNATQVFSVGPIPWDVLVFPKPHQLSWKCLETHGLLGTSFINVCGSPL